jgi:hypothetical protein
VLAAAIKAGAQVIVTLNLKDFPAGKLAPWNIKAKSPEDFVLDQIGIDRQSVGPVSSRLLIHARNAQSQ